MLLQTENVPRDKSQPFFKGDIINMVAPLTRYCLLAPNQKFPFHSTIISQNLHRITVDCSKFRPQTLGDAIAKLTTNNKTKPTEPSCLGGFVVSENLSIH